MFNVVRKIHKRGLKHRFSRQKTWVSEKKARAGGRKRTSTLWTRKNAYLVSTVIFALSNGRVLTGFGLLRNLPCGGKVRASDRRGNNCRWKLMITTPSNRCNLQEKN